MIGNTLILGAVFIVLMVIGIMGWVVNYEHEGTFRQWLFGALYFLGTAGFGICFVVLIILLITGG